MQQIKSFFKVYANMVFWSVCLLVDFSYLVLVVLDGRAWWVISLWSVSLLFALLGFVGSVLRVRGPKDDFRERLREMSKTGYVVPSNDRSKY